MLPADQIVNYFALVPAAERYASGRPRLHAAFVEHIRAIAAPDGGRFAHALDVGCGTGHSTLALLDIAERVTGADISPAMLARAPRHPRIVYVEAPAERLPFPDGAFDLVTTGLAFHWFDQPRFLAEAHRLLTAAGRLAIYTDTFPGEMIGNPAFAHWHGGRYGRRYPPPPRHPLLLADADAEAAGFAPLAHERFTVEVTFTPEELAAFLTTQSNVNAAADAGGEDVGAVREWIIAEAAPLFQSPAATFPFRCALDIFRRAGSEAR